MAFIIAGLSDDDDLWTAHEELLCQDCCACMPETMKNVVDIVSVLPDEAMNAGVARDSLVGTIWELIASAWTKDIDVILEVQGNVNLTLENEGDIILEDSWRVYPALGKDCQTKGSERCLKGCEVTGLLRESSVVISNKQIHHSIDRSGS